MPHLPRKQAPCAAILASMLLLAAPISGLAADDAKLELGKQVFTTEAVPQCAICHALADAEAVGEVGPSLDELKPTEDQVRAAVEGGVGVMPAYAELLTEEQIDAVSRYVAEAAGKE